MYRTVYMEGPHGLDIPSLIQKLENACTYRRKGLSDVNEDTGETGSGNVFSGAIDSGKLDQFDDLHVNSHMMTPRWCTRSDNRKRWKILFIILKLGRHLVMELLPEDGHSYKYSTVRYCSVGTIKTNVYTVQYLHTL